jgi:hypothetical protein
VYGHGHAGRVNPEIGASLRGTPSHERASFSDPLTTATGEDAPRHLRVAGSAPRTDAHDDVGGGDPLVDQGGFGSRGLSGERTHVEQPVDDEAPGR